MIKPGRRIGLMNVMADSYGNIEEQGKEILIAKETQKLNWYGTCSFKSLISSLCKPFKGIWGFEDSD